MSAETQGAETRTGEAPQITDHECEQFYRHAEDGATAEHDGVEYALIQPYDLQRFAMTVKALRRERDEARRALQEIADAAKGVEHAVGCGDHSCLFEKPKGMGTNGGCRCGYRGLVMGKLALLYRAALAARPAETPGGR